MKILFFATYPNLPIGYSRIANILSNYLALQGHTIYYLGISNFKGGEQIERNIHPNIILIDGLEEEKKLNNNELYGVNVICNYLELTKPDILFLYNDLIVISRIFNNFIERKINPNDYGCKVITYLDLVYPYEKINLIKHIDKFTDLIFVFGNYWKNNLIQIGIREQKIEILPHGFDSKIFFTINSIDAKTYFNFEPDDFVILNTNRNNYRKCIDKTIDSFIIFLTKNKMDSKIKLFLNMCIDDNSNTGYDIMNQINISCTINNIDVNEVLNKHIYISSSKLTDTQLNILYNACDVGINTCIGEGFGLCNLEHGGVGKPQIISYVGGLRDIFDSNYSIPIEPVEKFYISNSVDFHGGYGEICSTTDFVNAMDKYYLDYELRKTHGDLAKKTIIDKFYWNDILNQMEKKIIILRKNTTN